MKQKSIREVLVDYTDAITRGLLSFFLVGILLYILLIGYFHLSALWFLPIVFIVSIIISPLFQKIKVGERIFSQYEGWLNRKFGIWQKKI
jgi:hypothetical protein